ncbi:MAG: hypothetical protein RSH25_17400, partial [Bacteroides sp.]
MKAFIEKFREKYHLSETDVRILLSHVEEVRFRKREEIVREGARNTNLYFIREGIWRGHYLKDGCWHPVRLRRCIRRPARGC